jgi:hypothetical protein
MRVCALKESWIKFVIARRLVNSTGRDIMDIESATISRHALKIFQRN